MAGKTAILAIKIISDARAAAKGMDDTSSRATRMADRIKSAGRVAGQVLAVGIAAAAAAAVKFARAAGEDSAAASRLAQTLRKAAGASDTQVAATEKWITAQGKALGVADDELRPALAKLVAATKDVGQAQRDAALAMNISASSGKSLETISAALAKAELGNVAGLSRLGVQTKDAAGKTLAFAELRKQLNATYGGAAKNAAKTEAGQAKILAVQYDELTESIGSGLLPAMRKLVAVGLSVVGWIDKNRTTAALLAGSLFGLVAAVYAVGLAVRVYTAATIAWTAATAVATAVQSAFAAASIGTRIALAALAAQTTVVTAAVRVWTGVQAVFNAVMAANPIVLVVIAVVALVAAIVIAYKKSDAFRALVQTVGRACAAAFGWIVDKVRELAGWVGTNAPKAFEFLKAKVLPILELITAPQRKLLAIIIDIVGWVKDRLPAAFQVLKTVASTVGDVLLAPFKALLSIIEKVINAIGKIKIPHLPDLNPFGRTASTSTVAVAGTPVVVQLHMSGSFVGSEKQLAEQLAPVFEKTLQRIARR